MPDTSTGWTEIDVAGHPVDLFLPDDDQTIVGVVLFLHDLDGRTPRGDDVFTRLLTEHRLALAAPRIGADWWLDEVCPGFDAALTPLKYLVEAVIPELQRLFDVTPPQIAVTGFGAGGQGALQLAYRHARQFPVVAALAPMVDFHHWHGQGTMLDEIFSTAEQARQQTATLNLHPLNWPRHQLILSDPTDGYSHEGTERLISKLMSSGIPVEHDLETIVDSHTWTTCQAMAEKAMSFVAQHLAVKNAAKR